MLGEPSRDRAAERREATRREIIDVAWEMAQEKGLAEFTLRDVAARVGMRAPSIYTHFESKHAIYDAMFGQGWTEYEQLAQAQLADLPPGSARRGAPSCAVVLRLRGRQPRAPPAPEPAHDPWIRAQPGVLRARGPGGGDGTTALSRPRPERHGRLRHLGRDGRRPDQPAAGQRPRWHAVVGAAGPGHRHLGRRCRPSPGPVDPTSADRTPTGPASSDPGRRGAPHEHHHQRPGPAATPSRPRSRGRPRCGWPRRSTSASQTPSTPSRPTDWTRPTDCTAWDVRQLVAHIAGMANVRLDPAGDGAPDAGGQGPPTAGPGTRRRPDRGPGRGARPPGAR